MSTENKKCLSLNSPDEIYEKFPQVFTVEFKEVGKGKPKVRVVSNHFQLGDIITDNAYENDFYRYHDIFHYTYATMLGWSPCARALMKRKRKSNPIIDEVEDGARATITEEAISLIVFYEAKRKAFFTKTKKVSKRVLNFIKDITQSLEVKNRTEQEWEKAILKGYEIFNLLVKNKGGKVKFDLSNNSIEYVVAS